MKKRGTILIGFVSLVLIFSLASGSIAHAVPAPAISVSPSSIEASHGDSFTIDIKIDPEGAEIYGAQYDLYFDPGMLNATSQSQGTFLSQDSATTAVITDKINNTVGKIEYGESIMGAEHGVTNPGVLASITFEVIGTSGTSELKLSNVILSDPEVIPIETSINSGTCTMVTAGEPAISTTPTPTPTATYTNITVEEAHEMLTENPDQFILLDVRTEEEYNAEHIHIPEAKLIPLPELESRIGELDTNKKIIVYSQTGIKSRTASEILVQNNFEHVYNMLGGIDAWRLHFSEELVKPTPTSTPAVTPSPVLSPSPTISPSPPGSPIASPSPSPEHKNRIPGFEDVFAIASLAISFFIYTKTKTKKRR